jgi:hypothetical protein
VANVVGQNPVKFRVFQPSSGGESGVFDDFGVGGVFKYSSIEILQSIWPYTQKPNGTLDESINSGASSTQLTNTTQHQHHQYHFLQLHPSAFCDHRNDLQRPACLHASALRQSSSGNTHFVSSSSCTAWTPFAPTILWDVPFYKVMRLQLLEHLPIFFL